MSKYKIGDKVWIARFDTNKSIRVTCSVCYGKLKITLILGNGDKVDLPCDYCGKGNLGVPTGYEFEYQANSKPEMITIDGMRVDITESGEKIEYWSGAEGSHYIYREENMFGTHDEALARGKELAEKWRVEQRTRTEYVKQDIKKSFAWNAGYHMREAKRMEKQIEYHREHAKLCKERAKA